MNRVPHVPQPGDFPVPIPWESLPDRIHAVHSNLTPETIASGELDAEVRAMIREMSLRQIVSFWGHIAQRMPPELTYVRYYHNFLAGFVVRYFMLHALEEAVPEALPTDWAERPVSQVFQGYETTAEPPSSEGPRHDSNSIETHMFPNLGVRLECTSLSCIPARWERM